MNTRERFAATTAALLDERDDVALLYAEISGRFFTSAARRHPARVINVGIREQLLVSAGAGLALTGIRPVMHTFAPFLVERAFEQIKLSFGHQGVGGVLVSVGASYDMAAEGRTHQSPGDVALLMTLPGVTVHAPGSLAEVDAALREAAAGDGLHYVRVSAAVNGASYAPGVHVVRRGSGPTVVAFGPVLDEVLAAVRGTDATVVYGNRISADDVAAVAGAVTSTDVVLVEPWLEGTATHLLAAALTDRAHRFASIGVGRDEVRRYGTAADHQRWHGLDAAGIRRQLAEFVGA